MQSEPPSFKPLAIGPRYTLYSPGQMALATLLGTPIAGMILLGRNFAKLRRRGAAWLCYLFGIALTAGLVALLFGVPTFPSPISSCLAIMLVGVLGYTLQGDAITAHLRDGGRLASWWASVVIGVISALLAFMVLLAGALAYDVMTLPPKVEIAGGEIYYEGGTTEAQARETALLLVEAEYFDGAPASVWLGREDDHYTVELVVLAEGHTAEWRTFFEDLLEPLSQKAFGGAPVDIYLCDENWERVTKIGWDARSR